MRTISTNETSNFQGLGESNLEEEGEEIDQSLPACLPWLSSSRDNERGTALNVADFVFTSDFRLPWNRSSPIFSLFLSFPFLFLFSFFFFLFFDSLSPRRIGYLSATATPSILSNVIQWKAKRNTVPLRWLDSKEYERGRWRRGACTKCYLLFGEIRLSRENTLKFDRYRRMG